MSDVAMPPPGAPPGDFLALSDSWILEGLDSEFKELLLSELEFLAVPGGRVLFEEGQPPDAMYIITSGILGVVVGKPIEHGQLIAQIHAGETVGEMALLSQRPRSATVVALRDSSLLRLSRETFAKLMELNPKAMPRLASSLVDRLESTTHHSTSVGRPKTIALLPLSPDVPIASFTQSLASSFAKSDARVKVFDNAVSESTAETFYAAEVSHHLTLYQGVGGNTTWDKMCVRRADRILLIGAANRSAAECTAVQGLDDLPWRVVELVLLQNSGAKVPVPAKPWLKRFPVRAHYHVRENNFADCARLGRFLTGSAIALVLSGGGARGYGHIGVVKALAEAEIPIDLVGGVSFGSIVAGAVAAEWTEQEFYDRFHRAFVQSDPLADYVLPFVALTKGNVTTRRLREQFGEAQMEDLWRPCFATAANLTTGGLAVQRDGPLWEAVRASIAIPGLLPPWVVNGEVLVDGGVMNNLPSDVMRSMSSGPIIAVDVTDYEGLRPEQSPKKRWLEWLLTGRKPDGVRIVNILLQAASVGCLVQTKLSRSLVDVLLEPPLKGIGIRDWQSFEHAVDAGYRYTAERIDELQALRNSVRFN